MMSRTAAILRHQTEKGLVPDVITEIASSRVRSPRRLHPRGRGYLSGHCGGTSSMLFIIALFLIIFMPSAVLSQESDKTYQTKYVAISYADEKDLQTFTRNIGSGGLSFLRESPEKNPLLAKTRVDKIVETICSLLDMHPPNLRFGIALYRTQSEVTTAYYRASGSANAYKAQGAAGAAPIAFYSHGPRTIAVAIDNISDNILAHEIAHAIISAYFVTPPPARMQEILAQYMDKHFENQ
jgi:hypothetical protein